MYIGTATVCKQHRDFKIVPEKSELSSCLRQRRRHHEERHELSKSCASPDFTMAFRLQRALATTLTRHNAARRSRVSFSATAASDTVPASQRLHYDVIPKEDFGAFKEYSVIHTDRSLNLMSDPFQRVMRDLNQLMKVTYNADKVAIIPGYVQSE